MPKRHSKPLPCAFCGAPVARPTLRWDVFNSDGSLCGACECGAVLVVDETGKAGGVAVLDLQALAAGGDLERAMTLESGRDIEIVTRTVPAAAIRTVLPRGAYAHMPPTVWFGRLTDRVTPAGGDGGDGGDGDGVG